MAKKEKNNLSFRKKILMASMVFLFFVLLIASFFGKRGLIEIYRTERKKEALIQEIERLKNKEMKLRRDIEELEKNPKAVERKAREKLWLMKPDEKVIIKK